VRALRPVWAIAGKDVRLGLRERMTLVQSVSMPLNYLAMMVLFVLAGNHAPAAIVMLDHGPAARQMVTAVENSMTFNARVETASQAATQLNAGSLVAVITIPADFDASVRDGHPVAIPFRVDNLDEDLTDDATRGMRLAVASFYQQAAPSEAPFTVAEADQYPRDTGYVQFLAMSIMVIGLLVAGMLQGGAAAAREFEERTMTGLVLSPVRLWQVLAGRVLGAMVVSLPSAAAVTAVVVWIAGDRPANALLAAGTALLILLIACAAGVALGTWAKDRSVVAVIARGVPVPALFLSGVFAPLTYMPVAVQAIGNVLPTHSAVVLTQYAFRRLSTGTLPLGADAAIIAATMLAFAAAAAVALRKLAWTRRSARGAALSQAVPSAS